MDQLSGRLLVLCLVLVGCGDPDPQQTPICGDGVIDPGEECEPGRDACCDDTCHVAGALGTVCRTAAGDCDVAESCTGTDADCPADAFAAATTVCRTAAGDCDVAESCSGLVPDCPTDVYAVATECRPAAGDCDAAESCTGLDALCPADVFAGAATECRPAAGDCDVSEFCPGDDELCPTDDFASANTECRPAAGECDFAELCSGEQAACPLDTLVDLGIICREATGECDLAEVCPGNAASCPSDLLASPGATCDDCAAGSGNCDACDGAGVCVNLCGNAAVDSGEACDGADDDTCPGFCQADCTCGAAPSCLAYFQNGATTNGTYTIDPDGTGPISVYCDMTDGGWTYWVHAGLVAYWSFDGTSPGNADLGAITGAVVGGVTQETVVPGADFGTSVHFDEVETNRIELTGGITLTATSTVMYWTRVESCNNNRIALVNASSSTWLGDLRLTASAYRVSSVFQNSDDGCTPSLGSWVHSTYVDTGAAMNAYRDATAVVPTAYSYASFSGALLNRIGSRAGFGTNGFHGWMDDLAVFDRPLTAAEIELIHAQGRLGRPLRWR